VTVPSSAAVGGSGLALFERSEFSQTPTSASSAGDPQGTGSGSPFLWFVSFGEAKEMNSAAGPRPGLQRTQNHQTKKCKSAAGPRPSLQRTPTNFQ
jgi:hypothetical protein